MGKRFEGENPTFQSVLEAYRLLGIDELLGSAGRHTAFASKYNVLSETLEFCTIPGDFSAAEVAELIKDAGFGLASEAIPQAA
ncbi:MAG TPA: hypothetical protein VG944_19340 [Fimbriimonas sp.]|nr:hypothetical protein [Fimbriimonas sp.]